LLEILAIQERKEKRKIRKEEIKLFQFTDDMIMYTDNPMKLNKKPPRTSKCIQRCCSIQAQHKKSSKFLHASNEQLPNKTKSRNHWHIPLKIASPLKPSETYTGSVCPKLQKEEERSIRRPGQMETHTVFMG